MSVNDPIADALNIAPPETTIEVDQLPAVIANTATNETATDMQFAADNLKELVTKGSEALDQIMEVARLSQHPRAYEVVATTLNTLMQINRQIVDAAKIKKETVSTPEEKAKKVTNNNLFVGSTSELLTMLEKARGSRGI